jgi:tripartite ATP-independent transporter DctP family solute receptor
MGKSRILTTALAIVLGACGLVALETGQADAAKIVLKAGSTNAETATDPYAMGVRQFQKALELLAPGQFDVQYFPARQIGDEKELIEGLSFGTVDLAVITNAVIANVEPAFMLNDLPFLFANEAQAHDVLDGTVGNLMMAKLAAKKIVGLGFIEGGFRNMINNKRAIAKPADVEGVKFRVMQNPVYVEMFSSLGGNAIPMAFSEVFTATQQGTIDGLELPVAVVNSQKYNEVTKYLSLTKHTYSAIGLLMSQKTYDKLSEPQRIAVWRAAEIAKTEERKQSAVNEKAIIEELAKKGMTVNSIDDPAAFRAKVGKVYDMFRPKIGDDLLNMALEAVK